MQRIGGLINLKIADLFLVRSDLKGKVEPMESYWEACPSCQRKTTIPVWQYRENGEVKTYKYKSICTACQNGGRAYNADLDINQAISKKWFHIDENDNSGFKNYQTVNPSTERAIKTAKEYTKSLLSGTKNLNLLIMGSTGTGKSHLAKTIAKTAKEKDFKTAFIESTELFNLIKGTFGHTRHNEMLMDEYKSFDLVVVDDVGLESTKQDVDVSWSVREWTALINAREGKATIYTTNFDDENLSRVVGQRAFSRMYMNTKFIDLFTDDYRKNFKK